MGSSCRPSGRQLFPICNHYCPVKDSSFLRKAMYDNNLGWAMTVFDFNLVLHFRHSSPVGTWRGMAYELREERLRSTLGLLAQARILQVRSAVSRRSTAEKILVPRPVSLHG